MFSPFFSPGDLAVPGPTAKGGRASRGGRAARGTAAFGRCAARSAATLRRGRGSGDGRVPGRKNGENTIFLAKNGLF